MKFRSLNEAIRSVTNPKAKASPQEDEFLTDLTRAQIAAIKPLLKSKDTNKLKAYLVSQKIVNKNFEDIQGYKMDRDVLSVLQRSFSTYHEQVENESFSSLVEEQRYIEEYIELLEFALESIAEELECDVDDLVEDMAQTPQRTRQLRSMIDKAEKGKRPGGIGTAEYSDKQYNSTKSGAKKLRGYRKAEKDEKSGIKLFNKEVGSKKLYGRGGRVLSRKIRSTDTTNG